MELNQSDLVVEIASNDGYLLQFFTNADIQVLGIEPAAGVAKAAIAKGIPTQIVYFGESTAIELAKGKKPKLMIANNVLAHVPDLHDFIKGFSILIHDEGIITFEFPHLLNLIKNSQFDTIYHEHYSYLTAHSVREVARAHDLDLVHVDQLPTHGGSNRYWSSTQTIETFGTNSMFAWYSRLAVWNCSEGIKELNTNNQLRRASGFPIRCIKEK